MHASIVLCSALVIMSCVELKLLLLEGKLVLFQIVNWPCFKYFASCASCMTWCTIDEIHVGNHE